jgi:hypothetical protein
MRFPTSAASRSAGVQVANPRSCWPRGRGEEEVVDILTAEYDAPRDEIASDFQHLVARVRESGLVLVD